MNRLATIAFIALSVMSTVAAAEGQWLKYANKPNCYIWNPYPRDGERATWTGDCVERKASGYGTQTWEFSDRGVSKKTTYTGTMRDGRPHGHGVGVDADGYRYDGEFKNGKAHGRGILTTPDGIRHEGEFRNGKQHGHGVFTTRNGGRIEGEFRDGLLNGHGVAVLTNGNRFEGEFKNGYPNGQGTYTVKSGKVFQGRWKNGCFTNGVYVAALGKALDACGY